MDEAGITQYINATFEDVQTASADGATFFFYGTERMMPFATIVTADNDYDHASSLNRPDIFRLNIGIRKGTFQALFGTAPVQSGPDGVVDTGHDFSALNQLMPHPMYGAMSWVCVLNPGEETFCRVHPLLAEAYETAARRQERRSARSE